jgi:HK97 gp10 family phage protein
MALNRGKTIRIDMDFVPRLTKKFSDKFVKYDKEIERRMNQATQIIWATAHAKRPLVTRTMADAWGAKKRVSNPNEKYGVPVDTGRLQASIIKEVKRTSLGSFQGKVETNGVPYAGAMEYGTIYIAARPFMRPAVNLNKDFIKRTFAAKVDSNL